VEEDLSAIKEKYKEAIGYSKIVSQQHKQEVDDCLEIHFVPLMEQLIEFDLMSEQGVPLLKTWL